MPGVVGQNLAHQIIGRLETETDLQLHVPSARMNRSPGGRQPGPRGLARPLTWNGSWNEMTSYGSHPMFTEAS